MKKKEQDAIDAAYEVVYEWSIGSEHVHLPPLFDALKRLDKNRFYSEVQAGKLKRPPRGPVECVCGRPATHTQTRETLNGGSITVGLCDDHLTLFSPEPPPIPGLGLPETRGRRR